MGLLGRIVRGKKKEKIDLGEMRTFPPGPMKPFPERTDFSASAITHMQRLKGEIPTRKEARRAKRVRN